MFQSTPARGGRHIGPETIAALDGFNPRPRGAGDAVLPQKIERQNVSIHARAGRATAAHHQQHPQRYRFNPRPRGAGDFCDLIGATARCCFNPRPRGAGDWQAGAHSSQVIGFNPRPRGAGDAGSRTIRARTPRFNPRPRGAGDPVALVIGLASMIVSIHARAGRATSRSDRCRCWR